MKYCQSMKRVWLLLAIFSVVSVVVGAPLMALCALKLEYVPLVILTVFVGHGIWGAPFYFRALYREKRTLAILPVALSELRNGRRISYASLGEAVGLTEEGVRFLIERALRRGYISIVVGERQ